jgi:hypothetical protein
MTTIKVSFIDLSTLPFEIFITELDRLYADKTLPIQGVHRGPASLVMLAEWGKS